MLHLKVLGTLDLRTGDGTVVRSLLAQPKTTAVLIYLVLAKPRGFHRRDTLCALFWPEADEAHARGSLRQALSRLRRSAGRDVIETRGKEEIRVVPESVRCDALELETAAERQDHGRVMELYGGSLLPGFHLDDLSSFDHWLTGERHRFQNLVGTSARIRARDLIRGGQLVEAEPLARKALDLALPNDAVARELMKALAGVGDRVGAVRLFEHWSRRLSQELDMQPSAEMRSLVEHLRTAEDPPPEGSDAGPSEELQDQEGRSRERTVHSSGPAWAGAGRPGRAARTPEPGETRQPWIRPWLLVTLAFLLLAGGWAVLRRSDDSPVAAHRPTLVVLPLKCLSAGPEDVYLTSAIYEDLVTQLGRINGLHLIDRTSAEVYRERHTPIPVIAEELGVDYALSGGVRHVGNRLRIHLRLIDARSDRQIWTDTFDGEGAPEHLPEKVLEIQSHIVQSVVRNLGAVLRSEEWDRASRRSTHDPEAYRLYARGIEALRRNDLSQAESLFQRAIDRDPDFLAAHFWLVYTSGPIFAPHGLRTEERAERIRSAAERAVEIDPDSPDAVLAMGMYLYRVAEDWAGALEWMDRAAETLRGEYLYHYYHALAERRMGRWLESVASMEAAISLSPRRLPPRREGALTLTYLRRYEAAESLLGAMLEDDHSDALPWDYFTDAISWHYLLLTVWAGGGDLERLRSGIDTHGDYYCRWRHALAQGDGRRALAALREAPDVKTDGRIWWPEPLMAGIAWETQGDRERATAAYEEAVAILERAVAERPCDERRYAALGLAYAGLGRREEAIRNARRGAELLPLEEDALWGTEQLFTLAAVLARCGEVEESIRILERLLTVPSRLSAPNLRNHYLLRPLWNEPAFLDLLEREPGRVF